METEGRPRLRGWLDKLQTENLLEAAVVYGYFPCVSKGDDLILLDEDGNERTRFTFPRQRRGRRLCLADFFRPEESGETDVVGLQVVTVGSRIGEATAELFAADAYRDYLELHGLSVQLAEALAEYWHARVRSELGFAGEDPADDRGHVRPEVPRRPLLARLRRLPRPGGPRQDRRPAGAGADRRPALRGVPAPPRAVHRRDRHPPPRGEVLQRPS